MSNIAIAARASDLEASGQFLGRVVRAGEDGCYEVRGSYVSWQVKRAASCLLAPAPGDLVLVSGPAEGRMYLIAVIEAADQGPVRILAEGDLVLGSRTGSVQLRGADAVELHGARKMTLRTDDLTLQTAHAECRVDEMDYAGRRFNAVLATGRLVGQAWDVVVDRVTQLARTAFRMTEQTEQVRAGSLDYEAQRTARLHAQHNVVTATDLVKVDAKQVHMG